jgi:hypothetical protein
MALSLEWKRLVSRTSTRLPALHREPAQTLLLREMFSRNVLSHV